MDIEAFSLPACAEAVKSRMMNSLGQLFICNVIRLMSYMRPLRSISVLTVLCLAFSGIACSQQPVTRPGVQLIEMKTPDATALSSRKGSYTFKVPAGDWTDTGVTVALGDQLDFTATGTVTISDAPARGI